VGGEELGIGGGRGGIAAWRLTTEGTEDTEITKKKKEQDEQDV
jgi:hypothetical protein